MHEAEGARQAAARIIEGKSPHARIRLGKMRGDKNRFLALVKEFLRGSGFENSKIEVETVEVSAKCGCGFNGKVAVSEHVHFVRCPNCKRIAEIVSGNELEIMLL